MIRGFFKKVAAFSDLTAIPRLELTTSHSSGALSVLVYETIEYSRTR